MEVISVIALAIGLAMDCFAVSIATGASLKKIKVKNVLTMAGLFGGFQAGMSILGWVGGIALTGIIENIDHWIAFALLSAIGAKMIYEALKGGEESAKSMALAVLLVLAVATSIDALAVGISLAFVNSEIIVPAVIIGLFSLSFSIGGIRLGQRAGHLFGRKMEIVGGIILIGIGTRILLESLNGGLL